MGNLSHAIACATLGTSLSLCTGSVLAHKPTVQECREAGEFIRNAALARDAGMTRKDFVARLDAIFTLLRY